MLRRLAHLFGFRKKDDVLSRRFARIKELYEADETGPQLSVVSHIRHGMPARSVVGAEKTTKELLKQSLLESCAQNYQGVGAETVGSGTK